MPVLDHDDECPFCGATLRANAAVCRNCGASDEYGWDSVENNVEGLGVDYIDDAEDDFDYDDFVAREFPEHAEGRQHSSSGPSMAVRLVILALLASLIMTFVFV